MAVQNVFILLASYNGGQFIEEQICSIVAQDFRDWVLLARDDGSTDATHEILRRHASGEPRLRVLEGPSHNLGAKRNFEFLLQEALRGGAEYCFFCDQDDVWLPDKLSACLTMLCAAEAKHGQDFPLLVHSDLQVVDSGLGLVAASFLHRQHIDPEPRDPLKSLACQGLATGCTMAINRALATRSLPFCNAGVLHDRWIAAVAALYGKLLFLDRATVLYRQHAGNQRGAAGYFGTYGPNPVSALQGLPLLQRRARDSLQLMAALARLGESRAPPDPHNRVTLDTFTNIARTSGLQRLRLLLRNHILPQGMLRALAFLAGSLLAGRPAQQTGERKI